MKPLAIQWGEFKLLVLDIQIHIGDVLAGKKREDRWPIGLPKIQ